MLVDRLDFAFMLAAFTSYRSDGSEDCCGFSFTYSLDSLLLQKILSFVPFTWLEVIVALSMVLKLSELEGIKVDMVKLMLPLVSLKL